MRTFYEFFAGGGMARAGLGNGWHCSFANDLDVKKAASYRENWGQEGLVIKDICQLRVQDLPGRACLAWASFPCQDLSLAGMYAGLNGKRSGKFWQFWRLISDLAGDGRAPSVIVIENVCGALTSHGGKDFASIVGALAGGSYRPGAIVMDAARFVPQSRPRLFIVATRNKRPIPEGLRRVDPDKLWHPANLTGAHESLSEELKEAWIWWKLPPPPRRGKSLPDLIDDEPHGVQWHPTFETRRLLAMMSPINRRKLVQARRMQTRMIGGLYKRTRLDSDGKRTQRAEIRFDGIAGCLRTPTGGSSRQSILVVNGDDVRSRLLAPREAARLMGLPETYKLPMNYNEAYHLVGDGVVVPVVRFLAANLLEPLLIGEGEGETEAA